MKARKSIYLKAIYLIMLFSPLLAGFTMPPDLPVLKPSGGSVWIVDAAGSGDFLNLNEAGSSKAVIAGDTIRIKAGIYNSTGTFNKSGEPNKEIVWEAYGDGDVIISRGTDKSIFIYSSYIIIDGGPDRQIMFDGSLLTSGSHIIYTNAQATNITVRRVKFGHAAGGGHTLPYINNSISFLNKSSNLKFYNNEIFDSRGMGLYNRHGDNIEIRNNYIHEIAGGGIQSNPHSEGESTNSIWITGNIMKDVGKGYSRNGVSVLGHTVAAYIQNNIMYDCYTGIKSEGIGDPTKSRYIYNNTVYGSTNHNFYLKKVTAGTFVVKNNLAFNGSVSIATGMTVLDNLWDGTDPQFASTDYNSDDFLKLSPGSIDAIDKGGDLYSDGVQDDMYGTPRPKHDGFDIGAHEYVVNPPTSFTLK